MGKIRQIWNGEHRSFVRYATVITIVVLVWLGFFRRESLVKWVQSSAELHSQNRQIEKEEREIAAMSEKIRMISTNRDTLEQLARENFYFHAPGEDVYIDNK